MKLVTQSADEVVLKESDWSQVLLGILLTALGIFIAPFIISELARGAFIILLFLIFPILGIWMIISASWLTIDISKATGRIVVNQKKLFGGGVLTYSVSDAARVELRKAYEQSGRSTVLMHQTVLVLRDGTEVALDHSSGGTTGVSVNGMSVLLGTGKEASVGEQVATFLGVPFQEIQPPNTGFNLNIGGSSPGIQL